MQKIPIQVIGQECISHHGDAIEGKLMAAVDELKMSYRGTEYTQEDTEFEKSEDINEVNKD